MGQNRKPVHLSQREAVADLWPVAVIKFLDKSKSGEKGLVCLTIAGSIPSLQGRQGRNLKQLVTSHPKSRAERH